MSYGCYQCHGREAQGSSSTGPRLGPRPIAFAAFSRYVRRPTGQMPPYTAKVVSDTDMANIYAYVPVADAAAGGAVDPIAARTMMGSGIARDIHFAVRTLRRSPAFTLTAVLMLALGIGVNAMVFTVTSAVLFNGFPLVKDNDRIVYVTTGVGCCVSYPDFLDWRAQATSFTGMEMVHGLDRAVRDENDFLQRRTVTEVTAGTFRLAGQEPILGRDFLPSDEAPGAAPVAILRYEFWERQYGKRADVIGRTIRIDNVPTTIVGVMPRGFAFPQNEVMWIPMAPTPALMDRATGTTAGSRSAGSSTVQR